MSIANLAHVQVSAIMRGPSSDELVNVFTFENDTGAAVDYDTATSVLTDALDSLYGFAAPAMSSSIDFRSISLWDVEGAAPMGIVNWPTLDFGEAAGDPLPSQVAGFIFFRTHKARCIGKKFIPGPVEGHNGTDGKPTALYMAALAEFASDLISGVGSFGSVDWPFVVHSTADGLYYKPYNAIVQNVWSTVRRRRIGRGS